MTLKKNRRTCKKGHIYYKSSDCPTCPICEQERKLLVGIYIPTSGFPQLSAPARRALEHAGISTPHQLAKYSTKELLNLHGIGPSAIPKLKAFLEKEGLGFRK